MDSKKAQILLVEDHAIAQLATKAVLESFCECEVDVAPTGQEAIAMAIKPYDLILLDIGLPDMDGYQVATQIRGLTTEIHRKTPIIALTAHSLDEKLLMKARDVKITSILIKPLTSDHCKELISLFLVDPHMY